MAPLARLEELKVLLQPVLDRFDLVLIPSSGGEAPLGHQSTGLVTSTVVWQLLGLPIGTQIFNTRHHDLGLLKVDDRVWEALAS